MRKAVCTISVDELIKENCALIKAQKDDFEQSLTFLRNRVSKDLEKLQERCRGHWDAIEARLKELELIPKDFSPKEGGLFFDSDGNVIYMDDGEDPPNPFPQFIKG